MHGILEQSYAHLDNMELRCHSDYQTHDNIVSAGYDYMDGMQAATQPWQYVADDAAARGMTSSHMPAVDRGNSEYHPQLYPPYFNIPPTERVSNWLNNGESTVPPHYMPVPEYGDTSGLYLHSPDSESSYSGRLDGKKKRKRVQTPIQRKAANVRERRRMYHLNDAFDVLRKRLPAFNYEKRLSRIETLKLAITYISFMDGLVDGKDPSNISLRECKSGDIEHMFKAVLANEKDTSDEQPENDENDSEDEDL